MRSIMDAKPSHPQPSSDAPPASTDQVLAMIDASLAAGDLGHAFSGYLFLLQGGDQGCKDRIQDDFTTVLYRWVEQQEADGRREEALWCYEVSQRLWPENAEIHNSMGAFLYRLGQDEEAAACFCLALEIKPGYANARKNLNNIVSSQFKGWHFPMLNDKKRNSGYQTAITKAIAQGHDTVLDIGSGTGLFSMFAVNARAKSVHACEESKQMAELSHDILAANQMQDKIQLLHKRSTEISVPGDIPKRVSLVVTEIFDAGLFGEGVIGTLQHAWKHLLLPPKTLDSQRAGSFGRVIPAGAVVYAQVVQCRHVRKQYRLLNDNICNLDTGHLQTLHRTSIPEFQRSLTGYQEEPYTSERIHEVPFGYQALTPPIKVLEIDFNNPQVITEEHPTQKWKHIEVPVTSDGKVDAIVSWFDLHLDDTEQLSTSPESESCWEQTLFPVSRCDSACMGLAGNFKDDLCVKKRDTITVAVSCHEDCLQLKCAKITHHATSTTDSSFQVPDLTHEDSMEKMVTSFKEKLGTGPPSIDSSRSNCMRIDGDLGVQGVDGHYHACDLCDIFKPDTVAILNDHKFNNAFYNAITSLISHIRQPDNQVKAENSKSGNPPELLLQEENTPHAENPTKSQQSTKPTLSVVDISGGPPLTGLFAAKICKSTRVCIPTGQSETRSLIQTICRTNGIEGCVEFQVEPHPLSPSSEATWDVLVTDLVAPCGTLRERVLEDIAVGRVCALRPAGHVIPATLSVFAMCIECDSLQRDSEVLGTDATMGLKIADFINKYKVSTFLDIHLSNRSYKQLSKPFLAFHLDLNEKPRPDSTDLPSFVNLTMTHQLAAMDDGKITAVPFWYDIGVDAENHVNTLDNETHWKQAAFLLGEGQVVRKGDRVRVMARIEDSTFQFEVEVMR